MTVTDRRMVDAILYPAKEAVDGRQNRVMVADRANPINFKCTVVPQRSARAEVPGQVEIDVIKIITRSDLNFDLWSIVFVVGREWDVVTPTVLHRGGRATTYRAADLRRRPGG